MATTITAGNGTNGGAAVSSDNTGILELKTGTGAGTTALTLDASQNATVAGSASIQGLTVGRGAGAVATNTAVGYQAGYNNTTGAQNLFFGYQAGYGNTTASNNTFIGFGAASNAATVTGTDNTSVGSSSLYNLSSGSYNVAIGRQALQANTTASYNTAIGYQAGYSSTTNGSNTSVGFKALYATTGGFNTAIGDGSGIDITSGTKNTIVGRYGGNQDGLDIRTASNYAVISDGDGNRLLSMYNGGTLALDGGAVPQAGTGITFPATQSASTDANTLDDYEEGTFTPTVSGSTVAGTGTYSTQQGTYTKIGNLVTVNVWVQWTAHTGTGNLLFSNLPFASKNTTNYRASGSLGVVDVLALTANNVATIAFAPNSTNISALQYPVGGGGSTSVAMDTAANIHYSMTYQTST